MDSAYIVSPTARISPLADIELSVRGSLIAIGEDAVIDAFVKVKPAGGSGDLRIGRSVVINSGTVIYTGNGVTIGDFSMIAANCTIAATNHEYMSRDVLIRDQGFMTSRGGVIIEEDVWVGANSVLLDGAHLRRGCVIGAGSLVRGEVPSYSICVGTPVRVIGYRR